MGWREIANSVVPNLPATGFLKAHDKLAELLASLTMPEVAEPYPRSMMTGEVGPLVTSGEGPSSISTLGRDIAEIGNLTAEQAAKDIYDLGAGALRYANQSPFLKPLLLPSKAIESVLPYNTDDLADFLSSMGEEVVSQPRPEAFKAIERNPTLAMIEQSILGAGPAIMEYSLAGPAGPASMALVDAMKSSGRGEGILDQAKAGAKGAVMGQILHGLQPFSRPIRTAGAGTAMGGQALLEGASPTEALTQAVIGGGLGAGGPKEGMSFREGMYPAYKWLTEKIIPKATELAEPLTAKLADETGAIKIGKNDPIISTEFRLAQKAGLTDEEVMKFVTDNVADGVKYREIAEKVNKGEMTEDEGASAIKEVAKPEVPGLKTFQKLSEERGSISNEPTKEQKALEEARTMGEAETLSGTYLDKAAEHLTPEERSVSETMFKREASNIAEERRYKRTWDMVDKEVGDMQASVDWKNGKVWIRGKEIQKGKPLDDAASEILGRVLRRSEKNLEEAAKNYDNDPTNETAKTEFEQALQQAAIITNRFYGARAEAGRSLNILKKLKQPGDIYERRVVQFLKDVPPEQKDVILAEILKARREGTRLLNKGATPQEAVVPLRDVLNKYTQATWSEKFAEFVTMAKLTSPTTHARNIIGNTIFAVVQPIERTFSAAADVGPAFIRKLRGKHGREAYFGEAPAEAFGGMMALKQAFKEAWVVLKTGITAGTKGEEVNLFRPAIRGLKGEIIRFPGRALGAMDAFFKPIARNGVLWAEAYRAASKAGIRPGSGKFTDFIQEFVKNPPIEVTEKMQAEALKRLFQAPMTGVTKTLGKVRSEHPILRVLTSLFYNTPINIFKEVTKRSPAAILMPSVRADIKAGGAQASEAMGRIMMGSAFMASIVALAESGTIDITPPTQNQDERFMTGKPPGSIKIGDTWYNYSNIEPISTPLTWAAAAVDSWRNRDRLKAQQVVMKFIGDNYNNLKQLTYLQSLSDTIDFIDDAAQAVQGKGQSKSYIGRAASLPIPTVSGYVARAVDPIVRENKTVAQTVGRQFPWLSKLVPPKLDAYGEPIKYTGTPKDDSESMRLIKSLAPWEWIRSIIKPEQESKDPVEAELSDLYRETGAKISLPPRTYRGIELNTTEYNEMLSATGPDIKDKVWAFVNDEEAVPLHKKGNYMYWADMDAEERRSAIQKIVNAERDEFRGEDEQGDTFFDRIIQNRLDNMLSASDQKAFLKNLFVKKHLKLKDMNYWLEYLGE